MGGHGVYKMPNSETTCKDPQIWAIPSQPQQSTGFNRAFYFAFSANALLASQNNLTNSPLTLSPCQRQAVCSLLPLPGNSTFRIAGITAARILQLVVPGSEDLNSGQVFSFTPTRHLPGSKKWQCSHTAFNSIVLYKRCKRW